MSVEATAAVWAMRGVPATEKLVAIRIADHAGPDGHNAYPSVARLVADTGLSERAVQGALVRLCDRGVLSRSHLPGPKGTRRYNVNLEWSPPQEVHPAGDAPPQEMRGQEVHPPAGDAGDPPQEMHPNRNKNRKNTTTMSDDIARVFAAWQESTGRKRALLDEKRKRIIGARLKQFPADDLISAVDGWRHSAFHRGENDRHTVYNDLELLLRDAKHVEQFRDARDGPPRTTEQDNCPWT